MLDDYTILKTLGLAVEENTILFYDDESNEHILEFAEIISISIDKANVPVENKVRFWLGKLIRMQSLPAIFETKSNDEDYRDRYELEIELSNNRVLSRLLVDVDIIECKEFVDEINQIIAGYNDTADPDFQSGSYETER